VAPVPLGWALACFWGGGNFIMWRREAAYGFAVGAAVGGGLLSLGWLVGAATHWDVERWLPVAYVGLLAAAGAYGGSRWAALQQLAVTDPLTGLFNRRYFNSVLVKECARARRTGAPVSVLILDVDNFKLINDLMGH